MKTIIWIATFLFAGSSQAYCPKTTPVLIEIELRNCSAVRIDQDPRLTAHPKLGRYFTKPLVGTLVTGAVLSAKQVMEANENAVEGLRPKAKFSLVETTVFVEASPESLCNGDQSEDWFVTRKTCCDTGTISPICLLHSAVIAVKKTEPEIWEEYEPDDRKDR